MADNERILVFIPMYNCHVQIKRVLMQLQEDNVASHFHGVICIDNRSTDSTVDTAISYLEHVPVPYRAVMQNCENYGLGGSHKVAIRFAIDNEFSHLVVLHGDDQGSISDIVPFIVAGDHKRFDTLLGARFMASSRLVGYSILRTLANRAFNLMFSVIIGTRIFDLGSGLNLYRIGIFRDNFHIKFSDDLTFNYYMTLASYKRRISQKYFPLTWRQDDQISNARLFRHAIKMLVVLFHYILSPDRFQFAEHRNVQRESYPTTVIRSWKAPQN